ncbi:MAG TPA: pyridoxamine 5'-phosphate oxidase family protein [Terriglobales bacterium]|nr:pyridoxamine 5'-phosphate oxidase family protein [Terriglobales bacterium]
MRITFGRKLRCYADFMKFHRIQLAVVCLISLFASGAIAQEKEKPAAPLSRADLISAAREIMTAQQYCALITLGEDGRPVVRTMNPFPPDDNMIVWFATSTSTRKAQQIRRDPRVTLYYADHAKATGFVALSGTAVLVDDQAEIKKHWRAYWDSAFPDKTKLVLIKVMPERMDVLNYKRGALNDPVTWRTPSVDFSKPEPTAK